MFPDVHDGFISFITPFEAREPFMYLDQISLVTTGIGNLIDADDPQNFGSNAHLLPYAYDLGWFDKNTNVQSGKAEIDQEYNTVKFSGTAGKPIKAREDITTLLIPDAAIDPLVLSRLDSFEATLKSTPEFAALDTWPADAQLSLLSMAWAMGPAFAQGGKWPRFRAACATATTAIAADDVDTAVQAWTNAASESRISNANPDRNDANHKLFSNAAQVVQQGLEISHLQWPTVL